MSWVGSDLLFGLRVVRRKLWLEWDEALAADEFVVGSAVDPGRAVRAGEQDSVPLYSSFHWAVASKNDIA